MTALGKLTLTELKLFWRDPSILVLSLGLPLLLLVVNGIMAGDAPAGPDGLTQMDVITPMMCAAVLAIMAFSTLPQVLAVTRERGLLRRMAVTPVPPAMLLTAQLLVQLLAAAAGLVVLFVVAWLAYDISPPAAPVAFLAACVLGALALFALGFVIAALSPTSRAASAIGFAVGFPMLFLGGAFMPREALGETVRRIGDFTPLSPVVRSLRDTWAGGDLTLTSAAVLAALTVAGVGIAARWFRWR